MPAPRDYFVERSAFGRDMKARPVPPPWGIDEWASWHAAKLHHAVAVTFRERIADRDLRVREAAERVGMSPAYLGRVLRGEVWLSAQTLAKIERVAGDLVIAVRIPAYRDQRRVDRTGGTTYL